MYLHIVVLVVVLSTVSLAGGTLPSNSAHHHQTGDAATAGHVFAASGSAAGSANAVPDRPLHTPVVQPHLQQHPHQMNAGQQSQQQQQVHGMHMQQVPLRGGVPPLPPHIQVPPAPIPPHLLHILAPSASGEFAPDNAVEVLHDFKMAVGASHEDCLFQKVRQQSRFYLSFKVLGGSDDKVDVTVRSPDGTVIDQHLWSTEGVTDKFMSIGEGPFCVCIANIHRRLSSVLVHLFIATYVVPQLEQYDQELRQTNFSLGNAAKSLQKVVDHVADMRLRQSWSRQQSTGDYYVIRNNDVSVQFWSASLCVAIVCCSVAQVAFIHRLFDSPSTRNDRRKLRA